MRRPHRSVLFALAPLALAALAGLAAPPAGATTLGRMTLQIGGRSVDYRITDAATAGSAWEARPAGQQLSILWQGPKATDLLLMELLVKDGRALSGRIALPEARDGTLEAKMPRDLSVDLARVRTDGGWLKIRGRLSGTLYPLRRNGTALPEDGVRISGRFDSWVPGIFPAPPKTATGAAKGGGKAAGKASQGKQAAPKAAVRAPAAGRAAQPPRLRPAPPGPKPRPVAQTVPATQTAPAAGPKRERPRSPGASDTTQGADAPISAPRR